MSYSYFRADSVASAQKALADAAGSARLLAGGTDLLIQIKRGHVSAGCLVDIRHVAELNGIASAGGEVVIGACVRHREIEKHEYFQHRIQALCEGSRVVGGIQVRNMGTAGGNIVNASPAADLNPVLMALDASVVFRDGKGEHVTPLGEFITARSTTALGAEGIVTAIRFADPPTGTGTAFLKAGRRRAMEIALVNVAIRVRMAGDRIEDVRIVMGAVGPTMIRAEAAERLLVGEVPGEELVAEAARLAANEARPRDDVRATAQYRRHMAGVMVSRAIPVALERARKDARS